MIYNDEKIEIKNVIANNEFIEIIFDEDKSIVFNFNNKKFNLNDLEKNIEIDLIKKIYWDIELVTKETYYLFDITKEKVSLTKLNDNLFNLEVIIKNPNMIYSPIGKGATFKNFLINVHFKI